MESFKKQSSKMTRNLSNKHIGLGKKRTVDLEASSPTNKNKTLNMSQRSVDRKLVGISSPKNGQRDTYMRKKVDGQPGPGVYEMRSSMNQRGGFKYGSPGVNKNNTYVHASPGPGEYDYNYNQTHRSSRGASISNSKRGY